VQSRPGEGAEFVVRLAGAGGHSKTSQKEINTK